MLGNKYKLTTKTVTRNNYFPNSNRPVLGDVIHEKIHPSSELTRMDDEDDSAFTHRIHHNFIEDHLSGKAQPLFQYGSRAMNEVLNNNDEHNPDKYP